MTEPVVMKRRAPILDGRLSAAMMLAGDCRTFADIGADHGRLSAVMLLADERRTAHVADISAPALSKAQALLSRMGLTDRAAFAVADGLAGMAAPVDVVFVLGMGGETVSGILRRGQSKLHGAALVLGAQTDLPLVREALVEIGYRIRKEAAVHEGARDYVLMRAEPALPQESAYTPDELLLGPVFLKELPESWLPLLMQRERLLAGSIEAMRKAGLAKDAQRLQAFEFELGCVQHALSLMRKETTS